MNDDTTLFKVNLAVPLKSLAFHSRLFIINLPSASASVSSLSSHCSINLPLNHLDLLFPECTFYTLLKVPWRANIGIVRVALTLTPLLPVVNPNKQLPFRVPLKGCPCSFPLHHLIKVEVITLWCPLPCPDITALMSLYCCVVMYTYKWIYPSFTYILNSDYCNLYVWHLHRNSWELPL